MTCHFLVSPHLSGNLQSNFQAFLISRSTTPKSVSDPAFTREASAPEQLHFLSFMDSTGSIGLPQPEICPDGAHTGLKKPGSCLHFMPSYSLSMFSQASHVTERHKIRASKNGTFKGR